MKYYQEVTLIDGDKRLYKIWSDVFNQIHIALADIKNKHNVESIGVSFPSYRYEEKSGQIFAIMGNKLRVFAPSQKELETLNLDKWLVRLTDYVHIKGLKEVPTDRETSYVSVHRYRFKPVEVQAQALAKKLSIDYEEAMATVTKRKPEMLLPFIQMHSQTNDSDYRLKILQRSCSESKSGVFNVYGMNGMRDSVTVPHW